MFASWTCIEICIAGFASSPLNRWYLYLVPSNLMYLNSWCFVPVHVWISYQYHHLNLFCGLWCPCFSKFAMPGGLSTTGGRHLWCYGPGRVHGRGWGIGCVSCVSHWEKLGNVPKLPKSLGNLPIQVPGGTHTVYGNRMSDTSSSTKQRLFKSSHTVPSTNNCFFLRLNFLGRLSTGPTTREILVINCWGHWIFAGHERRTMLWCQRVWFSTLRVSRIHLDKRLFSIGLKPKNDKDCNTFGPVKVVFLTAGYDRLHIFPEERTPKSLVRCKSDDITRKWSSLP